MKRLALAVYILCFGIGTLSHARDFLTGGWLPYRHGPLAFRAFWTSLLLLDLAVVVLLARGKRRAGIALALAIMVADVTVNASYAWTQYGGWFPANVPIQALVLGFVLGSFGFLWPREAPASGAGVWSRARRGALASTPNKSRGGSTAKACSEASSRQRWRAADRAKTPPPPPVSGR